MRNHSEKIYKWIDLVLYLLHNFRYNTRKFWFHNKWYWITWVLKPWNGFFLFVLFSGANEQKSWTVRRMRWRPSHNKFKLCLLMNKNCTCFQNCMSTKNVFWLTSIVVENCVQTMGFFLVINNCVVCELKNWISR